jgi:hypothetical protein
VIVQAARDPRPAPPPVIHSLHAGGRTSGSSISVVDGAVASVRGSAVDLHVPQSKTWIAQNPREPDRWTAVTFAEVIERRAVTASLLILPTI